MRFVANVLSGFDDTMGATFFDLTELQVRGCDPLGAKPFCATMLGTTLSRAAIL